MTIHGKRPPVEPVLPEEVGEWLAAFETAQETAVPCGRCRSHWYLRMREKPLAWLLQHVGKEELTVARVRVSWSGEEVSNEHHTALFISERRVAEVFRPPWSLCERGNLKVSATEWNWSSYRTKTWRTPLSGAGFVGQCGRG